LSVDEEEIENKQRGGESNINVVNANLAGQEVELTAAEKRKLLRQRKKQKRTRLHKNGGS